MANVSRLEPARQAGTAFPELFAGLAAPFATNEVKTLSKGGRSLSYITAASVMNRLDEVLGPENWEANFTAGDRSVLCRLAITLPDGRELARHGVGAYAGMDDEGDDDKSAYSDGIKVAARGFGVARYLCGVGGPRYGVGAVEPAATPEPVAVPPASDRNGHGDRRNGHGDAGGNGRGVREPGEDDHAPPRAPQTGRQLWAYLKDRGEAVGVDLVGYFNKWARLQDFPGRVVDWDADQVAVALAEAERKLSQVRAAR